MHLCGADEDAEVDGVDEDAEVDGVDEDGEVDGVDEDGEVDGVEVLPPGNRPNIERYAIWTNQTHCSCCPVDKEGRCFNHDVPADDDAGDGDKDFDPPLQDTLATPHGCKSGDPVRCLYLYPLQASVARYGL